MTNPQPQGRYTLEEYLELETQSAVRHEFVHGDIFEMYGETTRHNRIVTNIFVRLHAAARGGPCRLYVEGVMVQVADEVIYYPDVVVDCAPGPEPERIVTTPCLLVEVASPGTCDTDRREKLFAYRAVATLRAYLLVEQDRRRVTRHWRDGRGEWQIQVYTETGAVPVPCAATDLSLDAIYEDISMPPLRVNEPAIDDYARDVHARVARTMAGVTDPDEGDDTPWS